MRFFVLIVGIYFLSIYPSSIWTQIDFVGFVVDDAGQPLEGVSVASNKTSDVVYTDKVGKFTIDGLYLDQKIELNFRLKGYSDLHTTLGIVPQERDTVFVLYRLSLDMTPIEIMAHRASPERPFTYTNVDKSKLEKETNAVDMPFVLQWTPSLVSTSDAGTGIGYTGMRIRGSDQTRINITLNGVPVNDAESQQVFWVNMPDLVTSISDVQIQRGVGASTLGAGAFGATVSLNTDAENMNKGLFLNTTLGTFNTKKINFGISTGEMVQGLSARFRLSRILSDGFIDRASADMKSQFVNVKYVWKNNALQFNYIGGSEKTYQAWYGVPEAIVTGDTVALSEHYYRNQGVIYMTSADSANLFNSDRRYNYYTYDNQIDNYTQRHFQLIHDVQWSKWIGKNVLYLTTGRGFFEEFRPFDNPQFYNINVTDTDGNSLTSADIIRQRWLDNNLVGFSTHWTYTYSSDLLFEMGLAVNRYNGEHFGDVIDIQEIIDFMPISQYYHNTGIKDDRSVFAKADYKLKHNIKAHVDLQYRFVRHEINGVDNGNILLNTGGDYNFINPKFGLVYMANDYSQIYATWGIAHKEPARSDFVDSNGPIALPSPEKLSNVELGYRRNNPRYGIQANIYYMYYENQLVLNGQLNDVGAPLRTNVPESYRLGMELDGFWRLSKYVDVLGNMALSRNKIEQFSEIIYDYTNGFDVTENVFSNTDISFSPTIVGGMGLVCRPLNKLDIGMNVRAVSRQFLDNTSNVARSIAPYSFTNVRISYAIDYFKNNNCIFNIHVNNIWDSKYVTNGYTYSYIFDAPITENFYYPQAGRNFFVSINFTLN